MPQVPHIQLRIIQSLLIKTIWKKTGKGTKQFSHYKE